MSVYIQALTCMYEVQGRMAERRKSSRHKSYLRGVICLADGSTIDCLVRDISEDGAGLKFDSPQTFTELVDLHIPAKNESFRGKVTWSDGCEAGVNFETSAVVKPAHSTKNELVVRVTALETEIHTLKQMIKRLQKYIDDKTVAA